MTIHQSFNRIFVGLPAFNEEPSIAALLARFSLLAEAGPRIELIIFDDGSTDNTVSMFKECSKGLKTHVLQSRVNQGLGHAVREIIRHFLLQSDDNDALVLMDCDNTHDPLQIIEMIREHKEHEGEVDLVVASRYRRGATVVGVPPLREFLSTCFSLVCRAMFPMARTRDYSCGFRYYSHKSLRRLSQHTKEKITNHEGFVAMPEILIRLRALGFQATEIPIVLRYDQKKSTSKMPALRNSVSLSIHMVAWRLGIEMP